MHEHFSAKSEFPVPRSTLFRFHTLPGAFARLNPPWAPAKVIRHEGIHDGAKVDLEVPLGPVLQGACKQRWHLQHEGFQEGYQFCDRLIRGPLPYWFHRHRFLEAGENLATLEDEIEYALPLGFLGTMVGGRFTRSMLERVFAYRHFVTRSSLSAHRATLIGDSPPRHIAISGCSGLVGAALAAFLSSGGHRVSALQRPQGAPSPWPSIPWNPAQGIAPSDLHDIDVVVHLAGENIAAQRWSPAVRQRIIESRTTPTRALAQSLATAPRRPALLIAASAIGFYGSHRDEEVNEESSRGSGFLAELTEQWEAATEPARAAGIRVVNLRIGVVLDPRGGILGKLIPPFYAGVGGPIGKGSQSMSWIALEDLLRIIHHVIDTPLSGPINAVAPHTCTNREFVAALGHALHRPTILPLPEQILKMIFGEMADQVILAHQKVLPEKLLASNFSFLFPEVSTALGFCISGVTPSPMK